MAKKLTEEHVMTILRAFAKGGLDDVPGDDLLEALAEASGMSFEEVDTAYTVIRVGTTHML